MEKCARCQEIPDGQLAYGLHEDCFIKWFGLPHVKEFQEVDPKKADSSSDSKVTLKKDSFFHGRYLKYSAKLNNVEYILKVQENKYPDLPAMEYTCNRIASLLSLSVPSYYLIDFQNCPTFVTKNFMQDYNRSTLHHIYKFLPQNPDYYTCQNIIKVLLKETNRLSEVIKFVEICLFDAFIGNNDRHGRNLGILYTPRGQLLAPMYDNPSYFGTEEELLGADIHPSGSIWTSKSKEPKAKDYIKEFKNLGLEPAVLRFQKKLLTQFDNILKEVNESLIIAKRKEAFTVFLKKRKEDFESLAPSHENSLLELLRKKREDENA